jgi:hypothetical protein
MKIRLAALSIPFVLSAIGGVHAQDQDNQTRFRMYLPAPILSSGPSGPPTPGVNDGLQVASESGFEADTQIGSFFTTLLTASGGTPPYSFDFAGEPPAGWSIVGDTLAGTASVFGDLSFTVIASDSSSPPLTEPISFSTEVVDAQPLATVFANRTFASGQFVYLTAPYVTGNDGPVTFSHQGGSMPPGLGVAANGRISGTVTAVTAMSGSATIRVADRYSHIDVAFDWSVTAPPSAQVTVPVAAYYRSGSAAWSTITGNGVPMLRDGDLATSVVSSFGGATVSLILDMGKTVQGNYLYVGGSFGPYQVIVGNDRNAMTNFGSARSSGGNVSLGSILAYRYIGITTTGNEIRFTELKFGMDGKYP